MNRMVVVYTPSYAIHPYKVVYDSGRKAKGYKRFGGAQEAAAYYEDLPAEDPSTKIFYVANWLSNKQLLHTLNNSMEICTEKQMGLLDKKRRE